MALLPSHIKFPKVLDHSEYFYPGHPDMWAVHSIPTAQVRDSECVIHLAQVGSGIGLNKVLLMEPVMCARHLAKSFTCIISFKTYAEAVK